MFSGRSRLLGLAGGTAFGLIACGTWTSAVAGEPQSAVQTAAAKTPGSTVSTISNQELEALPSRLDNLENVVNSLQVEVQKAKADAAAAKKAQQESDKKLESGWWNDTKISGRMYYNLSYVENDRSGTTQSNHGPGFDIKRFYVSIDHKFNDIFSADITTDFTYDSGVGATQLFIKKAYLDMNFDPAFDLRVGSTDLPWVPFVEGVYGLRYVENIMIDRTKFGTSADWGVHAKGKFADGMLNYAFSVVNGAGYKNPDATGHSQTMDFEGRVNLDVDNFILAVGGYVGKLGKDIHGTSTYHTAGRFDALAAYKTKQAVVGVEYFLASDWMNVASVTSDSAQGVSAFATYHFTPMWAVFGRYDYVEPNRDTNSNLSEDYFNLGVMYSPTKIVDFALAYKRDHAGDGSLGTSNGTIGGLDTMSSGTYDEVGIWGRFRW